MKTNFDDCFNRLLKDEGGYGNDPDDAGGATKYGITIGDYRKYIKKNATPDDVKTLTTDQAKTIYKGKYWDVLGCDTLSSGVDYTCFDYGVLSGIGRPAKDLKTFSTLSGDKLIDAINDERTKFLTTISNPASEAYAHNAKYRKGWLARTERVRSYSHVLASKKSPATGPAAAAVAAGGIFATMHNYFHLHPYTSVGIALAIGGAIWVLIHILRNSNAVAK